MHERVRRLRIVAAAAAVLALAGCTVSAPEPLPTAGGDVIDLDVGPRTSFVDAGPSGVTVADGDDWSLPGWVRPAPNSGYFSEEADASELVAVRSVDAILYSDFVTLLVADRAVPGRFSATRR